MCILIYIMYKKLAAINFLWCLFIYTAVGSKRMKELFLLGDLLLLLIIF